METRVRERRARPRLAVAIDARIQVLRPDGSGAHISLDGVIVDLCANGAKLVAFKMPRRDYLQIVNSDRLPYVQVYCTLQNQRVPTQLFGRMAYVDYRETEPDSSCQIGIKFGRMDVRDLKRIEEFMATL